MTPISVRRSRVRGAADDEYLETPPGSTYEHTDATIGIIVKLLFSLAVLAVVIHFGLGVVYALLIDRAMETGERRYPLAAAQGERLPPAPRLQQKPQNEFFEFRRDEQSLLEDGREQIARLDRLPPGAAGVVQRQLDDELGGG